MLTQQNRETDQYKTDSPVFKFVVAFTAGVSAVVFPRLSAAIGASQQVVEIDFFSRDFILTALVLGILIGVAVMWMEWRVPEKPGHTFMLALGIPALFSGGFSTTSATNSYIAATQAKQGLVKELQELEGIDIMAPTELTPVEDLEPVPETSSWLFSPSIASAEQSHPGNPSFRTVGFNPGLQVEKENGRFVVVLYSAQNEQDARAQAAKIKQQTPKIPVKIMKSDKGNYLVIHGGNPLSKSDALLEAIRLKRTTSLSPHLLQVQ